MPRYTYNGDEGRTYGDPDMPVEARTPEVGKSYDLKKAPDHRWTSQTAKKAARTRARKQAQAPTPEPDITAEPAQPANDEESAT